ncbi:MAG: MFS transporter [Chloroflexota bacterium]|nr:MAG: MFS transporter [Chloroflexota bacterium]
MKTFSVIWVGQVASLLGTAMSNFALTLWAYEHTGKATPLAMIGFFFVLPQVILSPFIGVLVDRGNRRLMMMLSDLAAALTTVFILILLATGNLQIWHLYLTATVYGIFQGFQWPAYSAAISLMLPKKHYARANAMLDMAANTSGIAAPLLAGALIAPIGLKGILFIDLASAAIAITTLLVVHIPQPERSEAGREGKGGILKELTFGFRYIFARPSLLGIQSVFLVGNFFGSLGYAVFPAMILGRTGNNEAIFASVQSIGALGGLAGGLLISIWGGPKRRVQGVLWGFIIGGLLGQMIQGIGQSLLIWGIGIFLASATNPMTNSSNQAIWQSKVEPDVQGRVFTARVFIAWMVMPIAQLIAGPLADQVLEPAMAEGGSLLTVFEWLVGSGTGAGIGLQTFFAGILSALAGVAGYFFPFIRNAEDILPDHDAVVTQKEG